MHGASRLLGWTWRSASGIPIVCVPGCPVQPDNFMETLLYLLYMATGRAPDDRARRAPSSYLALWANGS